MTKPQVVYFSVGSAGWDSPYSQDFFNALRAKTDLKHINTMADATALFTSDARRPVFTDDYTLTHPDNHELRAQAIEYIRSGGTIVGMGSFGSSMSKATAFFEELGVPWKAVSYYDEEFSLSSRFAHFKIDKLPFQYGMKAVHLMGVDKRDALYTPTPESEYEALGLRKRRTDEPVDEEIVAVAFTKVDDGRFGYIGDANKEDKSVNVLLAMLGVQ